MMKFVELLNRDMDKSAEALSREYGKTLPDPMGDVSRGLGSGPIDSYGTA